ncbi:hypothetical protein BDQ17DRAFT_385347 [Cyathus striatus]|nr:hypothetical protein BDQ17DRAFT_385347 [Cyathus striatus]
MFKLLVLSNHLLIFLSFISPTISAPLHAKRASPCFVTGTIALPAEVASGLSALAKAITCVNGPKQLRMYPTLFLGALRTAALTPEIVQVSSRICFVSGVGLGHWWHEAELFGRFQLNVYLAIEAGVRSQPNTSALLARLKGPKFFIQFQIARAKAARGESLTGGDTIEHQLGKVTKNAIGASASEVAQVNALATQI